MKENEGSDVMDDTQGQEVVEQQREERPLREDHMVGENEGRRLLPQKKIKQTESVDMRYLTMNIDEPAILEAR